MDREKVIKELMELKKYLPSTMWEPINNAITLVKDQDSVIEPEIEGDRYGWYYVCSKCHGDINWKDSFCRHCGRRINWNGESL